MKKLLLLGAIALSVSSFAQIVTIPDANFKAYLVGNTAINTNADTEIQVSEASAFTGTIDCEFSNISDLTGIEAFTALTTLFCGGNLLISLDVSNNTALDSLNTVENQLLTSLDVSNNTALTYLACSHSQITALDLSNNTALTSLYCSYSELTALDVSNNTALKTLWCYGNYLTALDVSNNTALTSLICSINQLTALDVSNNPALSALFCWSNQLTALDVSNNTALSQLTCHNNQLTALDVSNNYLVQLTCHNNQLTCLNVKNGYNTNMFAGFSADNNPNLTCIEVDDVAYSNANWTDIDAQTSFSTDCNNNSITQSGSLLTADQTGANYQWLDCDDNYAIINGETNQSYTPAVTGNYAVVVGGNGCSPDTSDCFLVDYTGLSEQYENVLSLFPNPTSHIIHLDGLNEIPGVMKLEITNSIGQVVIGLNEIKEEVEVSTFPQGVYYINITHKNGVEILRFVKQ